MSEHTWLGVLRAVSQQELEKAPRQHRLQTPQCPSLTRFPVARLQGWTPEEQQHVDSCPYCQRMLALTQTPIDEVASFLERFQSTAGTRTRELLSLGDTWEASMASLVARPEGEREEALRSFSEQNDPCYVLVAGEMDRGRAGQRSITSPIWFTHLLEPPERLSWTHPASQQAWQVRLWVHRGDTLLERQTSEPALVLGAETRQAIPPEKYCWWEARPVDGTDLGPVLVRAVFRLLPADAAAEIQGRLQTFQALPDPMERDLAAADLFLSEGLYESLEQLLHEWEARSRNDIEAFVRARLQANLHSRVHIDLVNKARLSEPEGLWAVEMAREAVLKGYRSLGIVR